MTKVDVGPFDAEAHKCNGLEECADPKLSDFPAAKVLTVVTDSFASENPEVTDMLSKMQFTNEQMNGVLAWQEENNASADEAAVYFLTTNKDIWADWLNDAAKEKLAALLK
jgi:glycine betaine/proline transport system substrate-binding protein